MFIFAARVVYLWISGFIFEARVVYFWSSCGLFLKLGWFIFEARVGLRGEGSRSRVFGEIARGTCSGKVAWASGLLGQGCSRGVCMDMRSPGFIFKVGRFIFEARAGYSLSFFLRSRGLFLKLGVNFRSFWLIFEVRGLFWSSGGLFLKFGFFPNEIFKCK